jgi:imidazole glycerol-phosphate synthase subunit HisF
MLRPRLIPCLLVHKGGLVKTQRFTAPKYVGDPLNAVRIYNEKEVDELVVLDIDASVAGREPDYVLIRNLAAECRMPLCYGGGVKTVAQAERIIGLGVEKVAISSAAVDDPDLIRGMAEVVGRQSVVVIIDVKSGHEVHTHNGTRASGLDAVELAQRSVELGAGEIVVNSIDNDGIMKGYDIELTDRMRKAISVPLTVLGGAGSLKDIGTLINRFGTIGAAAGSLFVFKGVYRAVLISYPNRFDKDALIAQAQSNQP